jgi:transposase
MAKREQLIVTGIEDRKQRYFSEEFKRKKVEEIERGISKVSQISRIYQVSGVAIYKWIYKYSLMRKKGIRMIVESGSDTAKIEALSKRIAELEQLLGQKQFQIEFMEKQFEISRDQYGIDLKKKASGRRSSGTGKTGNNTRTA